MRETRHDGSSGTGAVPKLPAAFAVNGKGLPEKLFTLRQTLYLKAKREPAIRFYTLYGLLARLDVLEAAWAQVAANDGAPGVDGVTIDTIIATPGGTARRHHATAGPRVDGPGSLDGRCRHRRAQGRDRGGQQAAR